MKVENIEVHGHDVIEMMEAANIDYSRETLIAAIGVKFGAGARFYTCSANGMDAGAIVDFLAAKGKFIGTPEAFRFDPARRCNH